MKQATYQGETYLVESGPFTKSGVEYILLVGPDGNPKRVVMEDVSDLMEVPVEPEPEPESESESSTPRSTRRGRATG